MITKVHGETMADNSYSSSNMQIHAKVMRGFMDLLIIARLWILRFFVTAVIIVCTLIGESLNKPHTSERYCKVNHDIIIHSWHS